MIFFNRIFNIFFIFFLFISLSCGKNNQYPPRYKNIPTGTNFFYGPNGNFYILPEEQIDSNTYRIRVYVDTTGKFKLEGLFKYVNTSYYPSYNLQIYKHIL